MVVVFMVMNNRLHVELFFFSLRCFLPEREREILLLQDHSYLCTCTRSGRMDGRMDWVRLQKEKKEIVLCCMYTQVVRSARKRETRKGVAFFFFFFFSSYSHCNGKVLSLYPFIRSCGENTFMDDRCRANEHRMDKCVRMEWKGEGKRNGDARTRGKESNVRGQIYGCLQE